VIFHSNLIGPLFNFLPLPVRKEEGLVAPNHGNNGESRISFLNINMVNLKILKKRYVIITIVVLIITATITTTSVYTVRQIYPQKQTKMID
jgi:hypothetical protein